MRKFEPTLRKEVDVLLGLILSSCLARESQPAEVGNHFKYLALDIVGQLAFGVALQAQTRAKNRFLALGITVSNYHNNLLMQFPFLAQPWLIRLMHIFTARQQQKNLVSLNKVIQRRKDKGVDAHYDLYHAVMKQMAAEGNEDIQLSELWAEASMFYVAGKFSLETRVFRRKELTNN